MEMLRLSQLCYGKVLQSASLRGILEKVLINFIFKKLLSLVPKTRLQVLRKN